MTSLADAIEALRRTVSDARSGDYAEVEDVVDAAVFKDPEIVGRSGAIARHIQVLSPRIDPLLWQAAQREARDAAPGDEHEQADALTEAWQAWRERWKGLQRWFVSSGFEPPQSELLRAKAGLGSPDGLTGNLAELRRVADRIDAALEPRKP